MKIAIVSQYYHPEPVSIPTTLAEELARRGHQVIVITGFPNYPLGELYAGYRLRWRQREHVRGVTIIRVPLIPDHSSRAARRIANYASFAASSATVLRSIRGADAVYVYATQMTAAAGPSLWRLLGGSPYVLHVQDLWPESITGSSLVGSSPAVKLVAATLTPWLRAVYRRAAAVIAIAPTMAETLSSRVPDPSRVVTLLNWADEAPATDDDVQVDIRSGAPDATHVVYAGNLGDLQGLDTAVRAAAEVGGGDRFRLHLFGSGVAESRLRELARELATSNVVFHGRVSQGVLADVAEQSDFQLVSLRDLPIMRGTIPSKLQASLRDGVPVIASVHGDVRAIVESDALGLAVAPEDVGALAGAFRRAMAMDETERTAMGARAREVYTSTMSLRHGVDVIESLLEQAAESGRA